jgi:hypothetical protein
MVHDGDQTIYSYSKSENGFILNSTISIDRPLKGFILWTDLNAKILVAVNSY